MRTRECPLCDDPLEFSHKRNYCAYYHCGETDCELEMIAFWEDDHE